MADPARLSGIERGAYDAITLVHWDHISDETLSELDRTSATGHWSKPGDRPG